MKTSIKLLAIILAFASHSLAQNDTANMNIKPNDEIQTIFGHKKMSHGFYLGANMNVSPLDDKVFFNSGGTLAWVINHHLAIGLSGSGFISEITTDKLVNTYDFAYTGGYGGLLIEPIIGSKFPVHISVPILIGAGGIAYTRFGDRYEYDNDWDDDDDDWDSHHDWDNDYKEQYNVDADAFFIAQPGIEAEMNVFKFMRVGLGSYYRYTTDVNLKNTSKTILHGFSFGGAIKIGKF